MTKANKITLWLIILATVVCTLFSFMPTVMPIAYAVDVQYSDVLEDLKKDSTFDTNEYPVVANDYSLKIIQLAESVDKELFVYVYQPCGKQEVRASSINISLTPYTDITPSNYKLKYINSNGVFFKYVVEGITVSNEETRSYAVVSILRPFNEAYGDKDAEHDNTVAEVPFAVGKEYRFLVKNGTCETNTVEFETIEITDKFVGLVRYPQGGCKFFGTDMACDSHFVAFDTDKPIDRLVSARVYWQEQKWSSLIDGSRVMYGDDITTCERDIDENDPFVSCEYKGFLSSATYAWERIESIDDFVNTVDFYEQIYAGALFSTCIDSKITAEGKEALFDKKWVLRFKETEYNPQKREYNGTSYYYIQTGTLIEDVMLLRLEFVTDGKTYNLGVVDNKQTGSNVPINDTTIETKFDPNKNFWKWVFIILIIVLAVVLLAPILPYILKAIVWVVSLPFRAIAALVKKSKEKKTEEQVLAESVKRKKRRAYGKKK